MSDDWLQTFTGKAFTPLHPIVDDIDIRDIAHALSMKCRFGGHCRRFYSVAEHSVLVSRHVTSQNRLAALLHDGSEAYLADIPRPVKPHITGYGLMEQQLDKAIAARFDLPYPWPLDVHDVDGRILLDEKDKLFGEEPLPWNLLGAPLGQLLFNWPPEHAERQFLAAFEKYVTERQVSAEFLRRGRERGTV